MLVLRLILLSTVVALAGASAFAQDVSESSIWQDQPDSERFQPASFLVDRDPAGLPGLRPRLTMSVPLGQDGQPTIGQRSPRSAFSWSLETWQLNTASLAHIQCSHHTMTIDSFLAEDCRFVDQPVPEDSINLVQVRGEWMAAPGLRVGIGAFHNQHDNNRQGSYLGAGGLANSSISLSPLSMSDPLSTQSVDGLDLNMSFGISTDRVGDFMLGLQVARYRQRMSLVDLGLISDPVASLGFQDYYANSAQVALGWRRGSFSGDIMGQHRDTPLWLSGGSTSAQINSFDLEFSWRPRNAALSIGISNVLDNSPRIDDTEVVMDDPLDQVFGRIPYVRYKHDL
jgi:hypothetical protein